MQTSIDSLEWKGFTLVENLVREIGKFIWTAEWFVNLCLGP